MNNDWIIWNGGDCPVSPDTIVQVQWADEDRLEAEECEERPANAVRWAWNSRNNIIAYRIISEMLWVEITGFVDRDGDCLFGRVKCLDDTHRLRIPMKLIDGKRVIDDSRQPAMEKL